MTKFETLITVIAAAFLLGGYAQQYEAEAATDSWDCLPHFVNCAGNGGINVARHGTVGLPFRWDLQAICNTGEWSLEGVEIQTGRLPPGLEYEPAQYAIHGVPTLAGSFSFQMLFRGIYCPGGDDHNGDYYSNYTIVVTGN